MRVTSTLLLAMLAVFAASGAAHADPLQGEVLKFSQRPMDQTPIQGALYFGHDEHSTAYAPFGPAPTLYRGDFMADDFADKLSSPVVHIRWWGSYLNNSDQFGKVSKFLVAFE